MSHEHSHGVPATAAHTKALVATLALVLLYLGVELVGGFLSGSLALLADAGHMLSDAGALGLTLFALRFAQKPPTTTRTYGFYRAEILAALVNGATLVGIAIFIFVEAFGRFRHPPAVEGGLMLAVACGGLAVNGIGLWILRAGPDAGLNVRGAWLHVLTDALGSVQAIVAGALIWLFGWNWVDPLASVLIGCLVIFSSWSLVRQSVAVLMEGAPGNINVDEVRGALEAIPGVTNVHDLHVWTITSGFAALSAHLTCTDPQRRDAVMAAAQRLLTRRFGLRHTTIQLDRDLNCHATVHAPVAPPSSADAAP